MLQSMRVTKRQTQFSDWAIATKHKTVLGSTPKEHTHDSFFLNCPLPSNTPRGQLLSCFKSFIIKKLKPLRTHQRIHLKMCKSYDLRVGRGYSQAPTPLSQHAVLSLCGGLTVLCWVEMWLAVTQIDLYTSGTRAGQKLNFCLLIWHQLRPIKSFAVTCIM